MTKENKIGKRRWTAIILLLALLILTQIPLPYYYSQPGDATSLRNMVTVENGYEEQGEFYLTTIRQRRANIPLFIWAQFSPYRNITPSEQFLREGETDEEYFHRQEMLMTSAQEDAKLTAYKAAGFPYEVDVLGVRVTQIIDEMDAANHLEEGDLIKEINGQSFESLEEMNELLESKKAGDEVEVTLIRNDNTEAVTVEMDTFPEELGADGRAGLGLLYPFTQRNVQFDPNVSIEAGAIGGPSAGLMFSLEIYNQLTEEDLTDGFHIAGTGTIDEEGKVGRIGGINQKIVAADNENVDIFFAPDDDMASPSNYEMAVKTAKDIGSDMEIVPVKQFEDALKYLENRQEEKKVHEGKAS
ncbi:SepM family pheromone-processing serine protease [Alteribacillus iranensis]|uniref:endopeptidase La n=1 Tax=Alteribacillus iranensis TaxID=930128 RepID=A0A1I2ABE4_9BACI|nr:SepM family pheromone-processing serine protease [Alteribacillus iranensis]SFE41291.1 PDZ domain-containing protein [Alteribacillus iranensis]